MLASELITWCNRLYEPSTTVNFETTDETWLMFFNEALNDLKPVLNIEKESLIDLVSGTTKYDIPSDCYLEQSVFIASDASDISNYQELKRVNARTRLYGNQYYIRNKQICIVDAEADVTSGLLLNYLSNHDALTVTTDDIIIENPYAVGLFALARVESADRAMDMSGARYLEYLNAKDNLSSLIDDEPTQMEEGW